MTESSRRVPRPGDLVTVDLVARAINVSVVVVGSGAREFLAHVHASTARERRFIDLTAPGEASIGYLPLELAPIRGFTTHVHLYAVDPDPRLVASAEEMGASASGIVVAERGSLDVVSSAMARALRGRVVPVVVLGPAELTHAWGARAGAAPAHVGAMEVTQVFPALKQMAREILTALKK